MVKLATRLSIFLWLNRKSGHYLPVLTAYRWKPYLYTAFSTVFGRGCVMLVATNAVYTSGGLVSIIGGFHNPGSKR